MSRETKEGIVYNVVKAKGIRGPKTRMLNLIRSMREAGSQLPHQVVDVRGADLAYAKSDLRRLLSAQRKVALIMGWKKLAIVIPRKMTLSFINMMTMTYAGVEPELEFFYDLDAAKAWVRKNRS